MALQSGRATPTDNDTAKLLFRLNDSVATVTEYAYIEVFARDVDDGTEDSTIRFITVTSSSGSPAQVELLEFGATAASLNYLEFNDSSLDADAIFDADSLDGAFCFDGTGAGALHVGVNQTTASTCTLTTRVHGSITGPDLDIERNADAVLYVEADRDNATETDNPCVVLGQDGGAIEGMLCLEGNAADHYTNSTANALYIETGTNGTAQALEIAINGGRQLSISAAEAWTLKNDGNGIAIDGTAPTECAYIPASAFGTDATSLAACSLNSATVAASWGTVTTNALPGCSLAGSVGNSTIFTSWLAPSNLSGTTADIYVNYEVACAAGATCTADATNIDSDDVCLGADTGPFSDLTAPATLTATAVWARDDIGTNSTFEAIYAKSPVLTITHGWTAGQLAIIGITRDQAGTSCGAAADDDFASDVWVVGITVCYPVADVFSGE
jgi:hypothetical protein